MADYFVSPSCEGESCWCGSTAIRKVREEHLPGDPNGRLHPLTTYVCEEHFLELFQAGAYKQLGLNYDEDSLEDLDFIPLNHARSKLVPGLPVSLINSFGDALLDYAPSMLLESWTGSEATCIWFDDQGTLHRATFLRAMLSYENTEDY